MNLIISNVSNVNPLFQVLKKKYYITDPKKFKKLVYKNNFTETNKVRTYSNNFFEKMKIKKNIFKI